MVFRRIPFLLNNIEHIFNISKQQAKILLTLAVKAIKLNAVLFITFGFQMVYATLYLAIGKSLAGSALSLSRQGIFLLSFNFSVAAVVWSKRRD